MVGGNIPRILNEAGTVEKPASEGVSRVKNDGQIQVHENVGVKKIRLAKMRSIACPPCWGSS